MDKEDLWKAPKPEGEYRGFESIPEETVEDFSHRMWELPPEEALFYWYEYLGIQME